MSTLLALLVGAFGFCVYVFFVSFRTISVQGRSIQYIARSIDGISGHEFT
jgi:hypothetical protein